ncbi:MAG TPA: methyltransferase [Bryobacteraceae bacterium]|jgi:SAM-dependent methyltransferase
MLLPPAPDDCRRLLDWFSETGYTFAGLTGRNLTERASRRYGTVKYLLEQTEEPSAFHMLARWFTIGVSVSAAQARATLPAWAIDLLAASGVLRAVNGDLEPTVMFSPLGTMLVASDPVLKWEDDPADLVLWPNPTTEQLFNFTIRKPFGSALDLGCGCGVQALGAATHCGSVTATDLSARAAEFTVFNARLNGIENVECAAGDGFDPVRGRRFDLIVANPPFFITPSSGLSYCENSLGLDLFCRRLAREAADHLNEQGFFQMVCEWVEIEGEPWRNRIAEWMEGSGCDAWAIKQYSMTPSKYGSERAHQRPPGGEHEFFAEWIAYARANRIAAVHGGVISMRKRSGKNWLRIDEEPISLKAAVGDVVLGAFSARDVLDVEAGLMRLRPRLAADARLVQLMGASDGQWSRQSLRLHLTGAMPRQIDIDPAVAQFIAQFDGKRRLDELIQALAERVNAPAQQVAGESIAVVRKLLAEGYIEV